MTHFVLHDFPACGTFEPGCILTAELDKVTCTKCLEQYKSILLSVASLAEKEVHILNERIDEIEASNT